MLIVYSSSNLNNFEIIKIENHASHVVTNL